MLSYWNERSTFTARCDDCEQEYVVKTKSALYDLRFSLRAFWWKGSLHLFCRGCYLPPMREWLVQRLLSAQYDPEPPPPKVDPKHVIREEVIEANVLEQDLIDRLASRVRHYQALNYTEPPGTALAHVLADGIREASGLADENFHRLSCRPTYPGKSCDECWRLNSAAWDFFAIRFSGLVNKLCEETDAPPCECVCHKTKGEER